jgi:hypothetical protein
VTTLRRLAVVAALACVVTLPGAWRPTLMQMRIVDTTLSLNPTSGTASTTFTATLTYLPPSKACPPNETVTFTWDGHALGSSRMHGSVSPCRAVLTTTPLHGYTSAGSHQVCGSFAYQGSHDACRAFTIASSGGSPSPKQSSHPSTVSTSRTTPRSVSSPGPAETKRSTTHTSPQRSPDAAGPPSAPGGTDGKGAFVGGALAVVVVVLARAAFWFRRKNFEGDRSPSK